MNTHDWTTTVAQIRREAYLRMKIANDPLCPMEEAEKKEYAEFKRRWISGKLEEINALLPPVLALLEITEDFLRKIHFRHMTADAGCIILRATQINRDDLVQSSLCLLVPVKALAFIGFIYERTPIPSLAKSIPEKHFALLDTRGFLEFWEYYLVSLSTQEGLLREIGLYFL